jgi:hypothetical protein
VFFSTRPRRKAAGVLIALAAYVGAVFLGSLAEDGSFLRIVPTLVLYLSFLVLSLLYTHGSVLRRPVPLPLEAMHTTAEQRFVHQKSWDTAAPTAEMVAALQDCFSGEGVRERLIGGTVWVEMGKGWRAGQWRHKDAARYLRFRPTAHFFVEEIDPAGAHGRGQQPAHEQGRRTDPACRVTAYYQDRRLQGLWDVLQLSDEMAEKAVEIACEATRGGGPANRP